MRRRINHIIGRVILLVVCIALGALMLSACAHAEVENTAQPVFDNEAVDTPVSEDASAESDAPAEPVATDAAEEAAATDEANDVKEATHPGTSGSGYVIVIDAGHQTNGDSDPEPIGPGASETKARVTGGTSGVSTGNPEYEVNLEVALKLRDELMRRGYTVVMCRESNDVNMSNSERAAIANEANADMFIRLHCDGLDSSSTSGFMTLVPGANEFVSGDLAATSQNAGEIMHAVIVSELGAHDRGVMQRTDLSGFNWCTVPSVLFEMGCMSNPAEDEALGSDEYQNRIATSIADGLDAYMLSR